MVMRRYSCEFCNKDILDYNFIKITHTIFDGIFICLFMGKLIAWMLFHSFKIKEIRNFPCTCTHKAMWHLTMFEGFNFPVDSINWFWLLFTYKLKRDEKQPLAECLKCMFRRDYEEKCLNFKPLNNLTYLENLYNKSK
jgi:hypothetical protein